MAKVTGILGKKVGMTQLFDDKGDVHPATVLQAGPCVITQHKTQTRDGYDAAQIGLVEFMKESRLTQPMKGHLGKHNLPPVKLCARSRSRLPTSRTRPARRSRPATGFWWISSKARRSWTWWSQQGARFRGGGPASSFRRWCQVARFDVSNSRLHRFVGVSFARVQGHADVGTHGRRPGDPAQSARVGRRQDENLLVVEGSVPGPNGGYLVITKAKKPPRERRGFGGAATVDPLKAAKRAAKKA